MMRLKENGGGECLPYASYLNCTLRPAPLRSPLVLDLFAGCGGLSLGFEAQGFETIGFEKDADSCHTYQQNLAGDCVQATLTPETPLPPATVVIGGPPCQPFSVIGRQAGIADARDGFPIFVSAVKRLQPDIWLFENVRGLFYRNKGYLETILDELRSLNYIVEVKLLNAADYGVPQNRERVVVVGHRGHFCFPAPRSQRLTAAEAIADTALTAPPESKFLTASMDNYVAAYEKASCCIRPRDLHLDKPARTLTCRNLAGATSDMQRVRLPDGRRRRILLQEALRLQSFPDWVEVQGNETSRFNQVGNAVPPLMAFHLAASIRSYLETTDRMTVKEIEASKPPRQLALL